MNIANLSFSALPPISVPFRYFISASIFLMLTSVLILCFGEVTWQSRWQPSMLAITHLFTLGFISMVMMGAIYQMLPVIGGVGVANVRTIAVISHSLHVLGTLALSWNFIFPSIIVRVIAMLALGVGFAFYIVAVAHVLIKKLSQGDTISGIRFALLSLVLVLLLGMFFLAQPMLTPYINLGYIADKNFTDIHALFGGFGWGGLLIFAVSLQVIPMFHVTPRFPKLLASYMPMVLILLLLLLFVVKPNSMGGQVVIAIVLIIYTVFNIAMLKLFKQRKRKIVDTSIQFWQLAGVSFIALTCCYFVPDTMFLHLFEGKKSLVLCAIFIYFYLVSIVQAMLLKIIPFLTYTHLQNLCLADFSAMTHLPHMHDLLLRKHGRVLFYLHIFSCLSLLITLAVTKFYVMFAFTMLVEFSWLLFLIIRSLYLFKQSLIKMNVSV